MKKILPVLFVSFLSFLPFFQAQAALFQEISQDAASLGDAQAGGAAAALDASTAFYNPAGLVRIQQQQAVIGDDAVMPTYDLGNDDGAEFYHRPFVHYAAPISERWSFGFSASSPFSMRTHWADDVATDVDTYDISPSLAYAVTDALSLGWGYDFVRVIPTDSQDIAWSNGWHGGVLYQLTPDTRVGFSYHSGIGDDVPAYATLSLFHGLNAQWALEGSVMRTEWSEVDNFYNTWSTALGIHYALTEQLMLRIGVAYETSPYKNDETIFVDAPVGANYDASVGMHIQFDKTLGADIGWTHTFYQDQADFSGSGDTLGAQVVWNMT